jgi:DNA-binding transcriptional LysR family regulator
MESIKNIQAFLEIAETGSFTKAANKLFITQPTITKRISQLEESLNHKLFHRVNNKVHLTQVGKELITYAKNIIQEWKNLKNKVECFNNEVIGDLNIYSNYHMGLHFLPSILKSYASKYPNVNLKIKLSYSLNIIEKINNLDSELGFVTLNENIPNSITTHLIKKNKAFAVIAKNHEIFSKSGNLIKNLNSIPALSPEFKMRHYSILQKTIIDNKLTSPELTNINMMEMIKSMVESGLGWSILTEDIISDKLEILPIIKSTEYINSVCIYHEKAELSKPAKAFLEMLPAYNK